MVYTVSYNVREGLKMSKKMLLPVGVVVLIIGVIILLLNPDPATTNLEIARNATNAREAAKAISSNNQTYAWMYSIGMFCRFAFWFARVDRYSLIPSKYPRILGRRIYR